MKHIARYSLAALLMFAADVAVMNAQTAKNQNPPQDMRQDKGGKAASGGVASLADLRAESRPLYEADDVRLDLHRAAALEHRDHRTPPFSSWRNDTGSAPRSIASTRALPTIAPWAREAMARTSRGSRTPKPARTGTGETSRTRSR